MIHTKYSNINNLGAVSSAGSPEQVYIFACLQRLIWPLFF